MGVDMRRNKTSVSQQSNIYFQILNVKLQLLQLFNVIAVIVSRLLLFLCPLPQLLQSSFSDFLHNYQRLSVYCPLMEEFVLDHI